MTAKDLLLAITYWRSVKVLLDVSLMNLMINAKFVNGRVYDVWLLTSWLVMFGL